MALKQHTDISEMIRQQRENAAMYVLPFVEQTLPIKSGIKVLEIGCGEGGVLKPFYDKGCLSVGVDLDGVRIDRAQDVFATEIATGNMRITLENVYDDAFKTKYKNFFDLIILKDVIEHIPQQENFIAGS